MRRDLALVIAVETVIILPFSPQKKVSGFPSISHPGQAKVISGLVCCQLLFLVSLAKFIITYAPLNK